MQNFEKAIVWLSACCSALDYRERVALLRAAARPENLFYDFEKICKNVLKDDKKRLYNSDCTSRIKETEKFLARLESKNRFAVTIASDDYPEQLKNGCAPPLVLYGEGNRALLKERLFCIVGSRRTPPWAEKTGRKIAEDLTQSFAVVTGIAEGGDSAAISGALPSGKLICVLPNGLDNCYPASQSFLRRRIREQGLLLSEFPFRESVNKGSFYARNRILAGLAEGVLVLSAGMKSGTLITVNYALDCGRDVFAFPYNVGVEQGEGCNALLKRYAFPVTESEDIFRVYNLKFVKKEKPPLSGYETRVMKVLADSGELHTAIVAEKTGLKIFEASATLSALELKGLITKSGGNKYCAL